MKRKINLFIFTLVLTAVFSITSVCGRRGGGHSSHGHSSHGHSSFGHSSSGHSSSGHSSSGHSSSDHSSSGHSSSGHSSSDHSSSDHSSSGHGSEGHISSGHPSEGHINSGYGSYGSYGHENSGNTGQSYGSEGHVGLGHAYDGSHHSDGDSSYHYDPRGQNYHNSETNLDSEGHHNYGSGGSGYHHYPHHHQAHGHYGSDTNKPISTTTTPVSNDTTPAPKIEESRLDLSCNNKLPTFMGKNYPKKEVEAVIQKMNMNKHSGQVTFEVQDHLIQRTRADFNQPGQSSSTPTSCNEIKLRTAPLGGCDIKGQAYIIVNVPDLEQVIETADCRSKYNLCRVDNANRGMCLQSKKYQKLLVLPAKQGPYNLSDLSIATFELRDGCKCLAPEHITIHDLIG